MRRTIPILLLLAFVGCAGKSNRTAQPAPESAFELRINPAILLEGNSARLTCYIPESYGSGRVRVALEDIVASERAIETMQTRVLVESVPCGTWLATCQILTSRGREARTQNVVARGQCNTESGGQ